MPLTVLNRQLKEIPQYTRMERHKWARWEHGTPLKWANFVRARIERKLRRLKIGSLPFFMVIDPCNLCNLRCPLCPTGVGKLGQKQAFMGVQHFKEYFEVLADYLFEIFLYNWGESLLNKNVYRMIEYAQSRNVGTNLSSNFMDVEKEDLRSLLDCGLEYLVVSLDGTSQETYGKYRVRGVYEQVLNNMSDLITWRKWRRSRLPIVEWQFIVMKHNEHEIPKAEQLARQVGVDSLRFIPVALQVLDEDREKLAKEWFPIRFRGRKHAEKGVEQQFGQAEKPSPCFYLYDTLTVNPLGKVHPCCVVYKPETEFGEFPIADIRQFWNNGKYLSARSLFSPKSLAEKRRVTCDGCDIFQKYQKDEVLVKQEEESYEQST